MRHEKRAGNRVTTLTIKFAIFPVIIQTFVLANETEKAKRALLYGTVHYIISRSIYMW